MDEAELHECISRLIREATRDECSDSDAERDGNDNINNNDNDSEEDDDFESSEEYQKLVTEVEGKLIEFLERQAKLKATEKETEAGPSKYSSTSTTLPIHQEHAYPCSDTFNVLPSPPEKWPQRYVLCNFVRRKGTLFLNFKSNFLLAYLSVFV